MIYVLRRGPAVLFLRAAVVGLSLATAYIHLSLGSTTSLMGLLFLANSAGFAVLALAFVVTVTTRQPLIDRFSSVPRLALAGFSALTITAYLALGPYFPLGWITKAIELALIAVIALEAAGVYGSPAGLASAVAASLRGCIPEKIRNA